MKSVMATLMLFVFPVLAFAQWYPQDNIPSDSSLGTIVFADALHGWIISEPGTLLTTRDGGDHWEKLETGTTAEFAGISFISSTEGWASGMVAGGDDLILHTIDGGDSWTVQYVTAYELGKIFFLDSANGWVPARDNAILETHDGGASWQTILFPDLVQPVAIRFVNSSTGYLGGTDYDGSLVAKIFKTTDGGMSWTNILAWSDDWMFSDLFFYDEMHGCFSATYMIQAIGGEEKNGNSVYFTADGGTTWSRRYDADGLSTVHLCLTGPQTGWGVTSGGRFLAIDGDADAITLTNPPYKNLHAIAFSGNLTGWAAGDEGVVMRTDNNGALGIPDDPAHESRQLHIFPNPVNEEANFSFYLEKECPVTLQIFNSLGVAVFCRIYDSESAGQQLLRADISSFPPGVYFCSISNSGTGKVLSSGMIVY